MVKQTLIAIDQFVNTFFKGYADETISARAWRNRNKTKAWGFARILIDCLFFVFTRNHCKIAYESEVERKQLPKEYR